MFGYKLLRRRSDGSLGPLFINRKQRIVPKRWYSAESHPTAGFALRPGWHILAEKNAPHLSKKGRVWARVEFTGYSEHRRPLSQGGLWYTADRMRVIEVIG
jgi:hypothetical protein